MQTFRVLGGDIFGGELGRSRGAGGVAFDYCVDSVNGSDSNDGTSADTAFASLGALPTLEAGDRVGLARGSHWREQLTISADNVTVAAYGETGERPLLDASDIVTGWTKTVGLTNVYERVVSLPSIGTGNGFLSVWQDDVRLVRVASTALCDSTVGSMYTTADDGTSATIYIHPIGSTDPAVDGNVYEYSRREYGLVARDATGVTVRGIWTRRNANIGASLWTGRNARLYDCLATDGNNHCVQVKDGSYLQDCEARNVYFTLDEPTHFVCFDTAPSGAGVTYDNCVAINDAAAIGYGFYGHVNSGSFGTVTYNNCTVTRVSRGFGGSGAQYEINDPIFSTTSGGWAIYTQGGAFVLRRGTYTGLASIVRIDGDNAVIALEDVVATTTAGGVSGSGIADNANVTLDGCNITAGEECVVLFGLTPTLTVHGTRLSAGGTRRYYYTDGVTTLDSDNNIFVNNKGFRIAGVNYADLAAYRAATGQDANSVQA